MTRICLLFSKKPKSQESVERMCGLALRAKEKGMDVVIYLLGDGVLCAMRNDKEAIGQSIRALLEEGITIRACKNDLLARAITENHVEQDIEILEDLEGTFVEDAMENAERVISW
jgi:sulfur relay protein TusB/DsrH